MTNDMLLEVKHVTKTFPVSKGFFSKSTQSLKAVDDVSFSLATGATMGLVGESGCGKSTMARLVLCLDRPDRGRVLFKGGNIYDLEGAGLKDFRKKVQIVFQDPFSSLNPRKRVGSIIGEPMLIHKLVSRRRLKEKVMALMTRVGLQEDHFDRFPHEFSSGQRQRIGIARALSLGPELIVADEPVSALDVSIQAQTINLLMDLQEQMQLTYLFISHDLNVVRFVSATVGVMYLGKIVEIAPSADLYEAPVHPYTEALLSAVPNADPNRRNKRILLQGEIPSPLNPPEGCVFSSRCPLAEPGMCFERQPPLEQKREGRWAACFLRG